MTFLAFAESIIALVAAKLLLAVAGLKRVGEMSVAEAEFSVAQFLYWPDPKPIGFGCVGRRRFWMRFPFCLKFSHLK